MASTNAYDSLIVRSSDGSRYLTFAQSVASSSAGGLSFDSSLCSPIVISPPPFSADELAAVITERETLTENATQDWVTEFDSALALPCESGSERRDKAITLYNLVRVRASSCRGALGFPAVCARRSSNVVFSCGFRGQVERFRSVCEAVAKTIVEDIQRPPELKRFAAANTTGVAGGEKFKVGNVFLKLAKDVFGVYGGCLRAFPRHVLDAFARLDVSPCR
jgi:hypothetical protein